MEILLLDWNDKMVVVIPCFSYVDHGIITLEKMLFLFPYQKRKIKPVHLVDVPGHSRLRPKLDEYLPKAAGIVFVVDALEFLPNCRAASE